MGKEANGRPTLAENDFGRRLHPSYGAMQLIEGWQGTKVAGGAGVEFYGGAGGDLL